VNARQTVNLTNQNPTVSTNDNAVFINMSSLSDPRRNKKQETLFGPNIGIVSSGPSWPDSLDEKKKITDELTPEIVKSWVERSKDVCHSHS